MNWKKALYESTSLIVTLPFTRIQNLLQTQKVHADLEHEVQHKGLFEYIKKMGKDEHYDQSYRGGTAKLASILLSASLPTAMKVIKSKLIDEGWNFVLVNAILGTSALALIYPFNVAYVKMTLDLGKVREIRSLKEFFVSRYKDRGFRSFFKGFGWLFLNIVVYRLTVRTLYQWAPVDLHQDKSWGVAVKKLAFGLIGSLVAYPLETIRKRIIATEDHPVTSHRDMNNVRFFSGLFDGYDFVVYQTLLNGLFGVLYEGFVGILLNKFLPSGEEVVVE